MKNSFFIKAILLIIFSISLYAIEVQKNGKNVDEYLDEQILVANEVIKNINKEKYLDNFSEDTYQQDVSYLENRIQINKRRNNTFAVKRDELKLIILKDNRTYEKTLKALVEAKRSLKDRNYFIKVLKTNIKALEQSKLESYKKYYDEEKTKDNKVANELVYNYETLQNQSEEHLFVLRYLLGHIDKYRDASFFVDYFNLDYFINSIDTNKQIYPISQFVSYYFKFSIGELFVVICIMLFFRIFNTKILSLLSSLISKILEKHEEDNTQSIREYIKTSVAQPLILSLYLFSIHISMNILIKNDEILNAVNPWVNTLYMGLLTWTIYALLNNSIKNYAQHLIDKYPNVRKEMIVFILRITKMLLVLFVLLFLLSQLGIDIKAIAASLGVGGIAIALASKDTLANFFGSLNIMTDNSFSQGDWILAGDVEGTVVDIRMRTTRIRTFDNGMITIPNSELANTPIKNYSKRRIGRRIKMSIGITYESSMTDIVNLKNDIYEMLTEHPKIATSKNSQLNPIKKFEAIKREDLQGVKRTLLVFIDAYDNSSINILIYCFSRTTNWEEWLAVKEDVLVKINELVVKNNCEFAYPTQTIQLKK